MNATELSGELVGSDMKFVGDADKCSVRVLGRGASWNRGN